MRDEKILTGPADHCRNNYDAPGVLPGTARLGPAAPANYYAAAINPDGRHPQDTCIAPARHSRNFLEVSSRRTRNCFVGGEIQLFACLAARPARASGRCGSSSGIPFQDGFQELNPTPIPNLHRRSKTLPGLQERRAQPASTSAPPAHPAGFRMMRALPWTPRPARTRSTTFACGETSGLAADLK